MKYLKFILFIVSVSIVSSCSKDDGGDGGSGIGKASLVFPLKDSECNEGVAVSDDSSKVTFEWNAASGALTYSLVLTNLNTNKEESHTVTGGATTKELTISRGVPYSWKVTSKGKKLSERADSETWRFFNAGAATVNYAPFPAEAVFPRIGSLASSITSIKWETSDVDNDALEFKLYLGESNPPTTLNTTTTTKGVDVSLDSNKVYYWRVVTEDSFGNTSTSPVFDFRTQ